MKSDMRPLNSALDHVPRGAVHVELLLQDGTTLTGHKFDLAPEIPVPWFRFYTWPYYRHIFYEDVICEHPLISPKPQP